MIGTTAVANAKSYDWSTWMIGLMRAFFVGVSTGMLTFGAGSIISLNLKQKILQAGMVSLGASIYRMGEFLSLHGAPDQLQATLVTAAVATDKASAAIADAQSQVAGK